MLGSTLLTKLVQFKYDFHPLIFFSTPFFHIFFNGPLFYSLNHFIFKIQKTKYYLLNKKKVKRNDRFYFRDFFCLNEISFLFVWMQIIEVVLRKQKKKKLGWYKKSAVLNWIETNGVESTGITQNNNNWFLFTIPLIILNCCR